MNKIIPALDVEREDALKLVEKLDKVSELLAGFKVGSPLAYENSVSIIQEIRDMTDVPIIFDGLGTSIPEITVEQVELFASAGADQIIAYLMGAGPETLRAFTKSCLANQITPVCVVEMTHLRADEYLNVGTPRKILGDSLEFGIRNFVYPVAETLRSHRGVINAKGDVTLKATDGGSLLEFQALGVTEFIVGGEIYNAEDPVQAVINFSEEING